MTSTMNWLIVSALKVCFCLFLWLYCVKKIRFCSHQSIPRFHLQRDIREMENKTSLSVCCVCTTSSLHELDHIMESLSLLSYEIIFLSVGGSGGFFSPCLSVERVLELEQAILPKTSEGNDEGHRTSSQKWDPARASYPNWSWLPRNTMQRTRLSLWML